MNGEAAAEAVGTRRFPVYGEAVPKGLKGSSSNEPTFLFKIDLFENTLKIVSAHDIIKQCPSRSRRMQNAQCGLLFEQAALVPCLDVSTR